MPENSKVWLFLIDSCMEDVVWAVCGRNEANGCLKSYFDFVCFICVRLTHACCITLCAIALLFSLQSWAVGRARLGSGLWLPVHLVSPSISPRSKSISTRAMKMKNPSENMSCRLVICHMLCHVTLSQTFTQTNKHVGI